jgi:hypothetical protein
MAANTRTPLAREHDLREAAALYLRGLTQGEIARRLGVSRQQVGYDLKVLQRRWQESALADFNAQKAAELAKVDELERTYWEACERSCQARETSTQERIQGGGQADGGRLRRPAAEPVRRPSFAALAPSYQLHGRGGRPGGPGADAAPAPAGGGRPDGGRPGGG